MGGHQTRAKQTDKCTDIASSEGFIREGGGKACMEREGEARGKQSFKSIVTCYLVVAGKKRFETDG